MQRVQLGNITLYNGDCMDYLRECENNAFELAIVDPPYSNGNGKVERTGGTWASKYGKKIHEWDKLPPPLEYFQELFRVSKNQIIWGANYFPNMPPTRCFIVWRKHIPENFTMAMCEYAWTSFDANAKCYEHSSVGTSNDPRWHPSQKPIALYKWLLNNYAHEGDRILDTHLGSGSIAIACHDLNFQLTGIELDSDYFQKAVHRIKEHQRQLKLF